MLFRQELVNVDGVLEISLILVTPGLKSNSEEIREVMLARVPDLTPRPAIGDNRISAALAIPGEASSSANPVKSARKCICSPTRTAT